MNETHAGNVTKTEEGENAEETEVEEETDEIIDGMVEFIDLPEDQL